MFWVLLLPSYFFCFRPPYTACCATTHLVLVAFLLRSRIGLLPDMFGYMITYLRFHKPDFSLSLAHYCLPRTLDDVEQ